MITFDCLEAQEVVTGRTGWSAPKDCCLTMGANPGFAWGRINGRRHSVGLFSAFSTTLLRPDRFTSCSSQPNSTLPRMRDPAATVKDLALKSPTNWPDSKSVTCVEALIFPSTSPPTVTVSALISALMWAPDSMVRFPFTRTSPLNRPAIRMSPSPSILPSMVSPAPIRDALESTGCPFGRRGVSEGGGFSLIVSSELVEASGFIRSFHIVTRFSPFLRY